MKTAISIGVLLLAICAALLHPDVNVRRLISDANSVLKTYFEWAVPNSQSTPSTSPPEHQTTPSSQLSPQARTLSLDPDNGGTGDYVIESGWVFEQQIAGDANSQYLVATIDESVIASPLITLREHAVCLEVFTHVGGGGSPTLEVQQFWPSRNSRASLQIKQMLHLADLKLRKFTVAPSAEPTVVKFISHGGSTHGPHNAKVHLFEIEATDGECVKAPPQGAHAH